MTRGVAAVSEPLSASYGSRSKKTPRGVAAVSEPPSANMLFGQHLLLLLDVFIHVLLLWLVSRRAVFGR